jgi:hypothetical protein
VGRRRHSADLPPRDDSPAPKPEDIDTNEEALKEWKRQAAEVHEQNAQLFSQRLESSNGSGWPRSSSTSRPSGSRTRSTSAAGSTRSAVTGLHPQADDGGKALLEFAHGLPLGKSGAYWLAVHIANLFGVDKVSFADRVEWTYDHAAQLIDSAVSPLDGAASGPPRTHRGWPSPPPSSSPASSSTEKPMSRTCPSPSTDRNSGLQHFSALLRDPTGAAAVNLVPSDPLRRLRRSRATRSSARRCDSDPRAALWRGGGYRKIAKRPTMTYVYSATRYGVQDMILQTLKELDEEGEPYLGGADNYEAANYLSYIMFEAIAEVVSRAARSDGVAPEGRQGRQRTPASADVDDARRVPVRQDYRIQPTASGSTVHWRGEALKLMLAQDSPTRTPGPGQRDRPELRPLARRGAPSGARAGGEGGRDRLPRRWSMTASRPTRRGLTTSPGCCARRSSSSTSPTSSPVPRRDRRRAAGAVEGCSPAATGVRHARPRGGAPFALSLRLMCHRHANVPSAARLREPSFRIVDALQFSDPAVQLDALFVSAVAMATVVGLDPHEMVTRAKRLLPSVDGPFSDQVSAMTDYAKGELKMIPQVRAVGRQNAHRQAQDVLYLDLRFLKSCERDLVHLQNDDPYPNRHLRVVPTRQQRRFEERNGGPRVVGFTPMWPRIRLPNETPQHLELSPGGYERPTGTHRGPSRRRSGHRNGP